MTKIMSKRQGLGQIFVQPQCSGDASGNLRHFEGMGQARAEMIALMGHKYLCFLFQTPESG